MKRITTPPKPKPFLIKVNERNGKRGFAHIADERGAAICHGIASPHNYQRFETANGLPVCRLCLAQMRGRNDGKA